eukprot:252335-Pleurochrysis_carterae.AAC.1
MCISVPGLAGTKGRHEGEITKERAASGEWRARWWITKKASQCWLPAPERRRKYCSHAISRWLQRVQQGPRGAREDERTESCRRLLSRMTSVSACNSSVTVRWDV